MSLLKDAVYNLQPGKAYFLTENGYTFKARFDGMTDQSYWAGKGVPMNNIYEKAIFTTYDDEIEDYFGQRIYHWGPTGTDGSRITVSGPVGGKRGKKTRRGKRSAKKTHRRRR